MLLILTILVIGTFGGCAWVRNELVKLKAVYELLETTTDKCHVVGKVIEGVVLENG